MEIVYLRPEELTPYEKNARKHADADIDAIRASIREFGFRDPVGIWGPKNIIVEGHGRQLAAIAEGLETIPCIRLDELTDEQRRAYALAHNRTAELSEWDMDIQAAELHDITEIDMEQFGFDINEFEPTEKERDEVDYHESISVVIECETDEQAEELYNRLTDEGYQCRISTL